MAHLAVRLLGTFQVTLAEAPVTAFESDKVRALLAYLLVEAQPHRRAALIGLLWPDMPEASARHNLSQVLFNLRQLLGDRTAQPPFLIANRDAIQFSPASDASLDVTTFQRLLAACDAHPHEQIERCPSCLQQLQQAVDLYRGDFLHQFFLNDSAAFEEWSVLQREHLHRRALTALTHLAAANEASGDYPRAIQNCERQLALDPWREEAHCQLMRVLARSGQRSAALARFDTCRRILADELGVEPSAETRQLYEQIRNDEFDKVTSRPEGISSVTLSPPHPVTARLRSPNALSNSHNLPTQLTPFIGRERELEEIKSLLAQPDCRLLTLVGPGGMGKTRLAIAAAAQQQAAFAHGLAFISLAAVVDGQLLVPAIADAIGLSFFGSTSLQQQLLNHLRPKEVLLVLDNLEQLLADEQCSLLVLAILQQAPGVKLLVTSREPLNIQGEWLFAVEGLGSAATELFRQSVRRVRAGIGLNSADQPLVERICQLVGEMPLGIELAATWMRTLSCAEIVQEIERSFDFLTGNRRDLPARHRSLRAVFDQSWSLLSPEEQRGLRQAAVFRGGFRREAAAHVADLSLALLAALVNKFLLRHSSEGRYDLHEVVRQYAALRLHEDLQAEAMVRARHAIYYLDQVQALDEALHSRGQQTALATLTAEIDNIRLALAWAITNQQVDHLRRVAATLRHYYDVRNAFSEGEATFRRAVEMVQTLSEQGEIDPQAAEGALGHFQAHWVWFLSRLGLLSPERRLTLLDESITLLRRHDEPAALADALWFSRGAAWHLGQFDLAEQQLRESLALNQALQRAWSIAAVTVDMGWVAYQQGRADEAEAKLREALRLGRILGDPRLIAQTVGYLSHTLYAVGRLSEMHDLLHETLTLAQATGDRMGMLYAIEHLAYEAHSVGKQAEAERWFETFFTLSKEIGNVQGPARLYNALGRQAVSDGHWEQAQCHFLAALRIAQQAHLAAATLEALLGLAQVYAHEGRSEAALTLAWYVLHQPTCAQVTKKRAEPLYTALASALPAEQLALMQVQLQTKPLDVVAGELLAAYPLP